MGDWQLILLDAVPDLRRVVLVLAGFNLAWLGPLGFASVLRGEVKGFPHAELALPTSAILAGVIGFQSAYLFEGVPDAPHWRHAINLALIAAGLFFLLVMRFLRWLDQRAVERASQEHYG